MKELQEKHKGDRETLQKEMMKLYQKEKVNPLMGCLPMFLQIPVFLGLFHVLRHLRPGPTRGPRRCTAGRVAEFDERVAGAAVRRADRRRSSARAPPS